MIFNLEIILLFNIKIKTKLKMKWKSNLKHVLSENLLVFLSQFFVDDCAKFRKIDKPIPEVDKSKKD